MHSILDKPIELDCKVAGSAPITISWYHNGQEIESGPNYEISFVENTCTLKLPHLKLSDAGSYKCKAVNSAGTAETSASLEVKGQYLGLKCGHMSGCFFLSLIYLALGISINFSVHEQHSFFMFTAEPPSFVMPPQSVEALPGSNVKYTATVRGSAPLKVKWFRGSKEIMPSEACAIALRGDVATLDLFTIDKSHAGEYTCQIINDVGKESFPVSLFVKG